MIRIASVTTLLKAIPREAVVSKAATAIALSISKMKILNIRMNYKNPKKIRYGFLLRPQIGTLSVIKP